MLDIKFASHSSHNGTVYHRSMCKFTPLLACLISLYVILPSKLQLQLQLQFPIIIPSALAFVAIVNADAKPPFSSKASSSRRSVFQIAPRCDIIVPTSQTLIHAHTHELTLTSTLMTTTTMRMSKDDTDTKAFISGHKESKPSDPRAVSKNIEASKLYSLAGILSALSWIATSYVALSYHPDPKFMDCTLRHNILTMTQAFAFPLPILWAAFEVLRKKSTSVSASPTSTDIDSNTDNDTDTNTNLRRRLNLGVGVASLWLAASAACASNFAFGYDLYSFRHKAIVTTVHAATALLALKNCKLSSLGQLVRYMNDGLWNLAPQKQIQIQIRNNHDENKINRNRNRNSGMYATGATGLLYFAIQPIVSPFPLATIPTILGKRLSRPASAFTLLGAIIAYSLKDQEIDTTANLDNSRTLRRGLVLGSGCHLQLIFLKIIGVDGGGLLFPGRGLWEVYPAMISVPFATGMSLGIHGVLCYAAFTDRRE